MIENVLFFYLFIFETRKGRVFVRENCCLLKVEISQRNEGVCDRKSFQFVKFADINDRELCFN